MILFPSIPHFPPEDRKKVRSLLFSSSFLCSLFSLSLSEFLHLSSHFTFLKILDSFSQCEIFEKEFVIHLIEKSLLHIWSSIATFLEHTIYLLFTYSSSSSLSSSSSPSLPSSSSQKQSVELIITQNQNDSFPIFLLFFRTQLNSSSTLQLASDALLAISSLLHVIISLFGNQKSLMKQFGDLYCPILCHSICDHILSPALLSHTLSSYSFHLLLSSVDVLSQRVDQFGCSFGHERSKHQLVQCILQRDVIACQSRQVCLLDSARNAALENHFDIIALSPTHSDLKNVNSENPNWVKLRTKMESRVCREESFCLYKEFEDENSLRAILSDPQISNKMNLEENASKNVPMTSQMKEKIEEDAPLQQLMQIRPFVFPLCSVFSGVFNLVQEIERQLEFFFRHIDRIRLYFEHDFTTSTEEPEGSRSCDGIRDVEHEYEEGIETKQLIHPVDVLYTAATSVQQSIDVYFSVTSAVHMDHIQTETTLSMALFTSMMYAAHHLILAGHKIHAYANSLISDGCLPPPPHHFIPSSPPTPISTPSSPPSPTTQFYSDSVQQNSFSLTAISSLCIHSSVLLRSEGIRFFDCHLTTQKKELDVLFGATSLHATHIPVKYDSIMEALHRVLSRIRHLCHEWSFILPHRTLLYAFSSLFDPFCDSLCSHVLSLPDIAERESHTLSELLNSFLFTGSHIVDELVHPASSAGPHRLPPPIHFH